MRGHQPEVINQCRGSYWQQLRIAEESFAKSDVPELDVWLFTWFRSLEAQLFAAMDEIIVTKALTLARELNIQDFNAITNSCEVSKTDMGPMGGY